jgi:hypothetical protein
MGDRELVPWRCRRFQVYTYEPSLVRSLLKHDFAEIEWVYLNAPHGRNERVDDLGAIGNQRGQREIEGIQATMPVGAVTIKGSPRTTDDHSSIIYTPEDAEKAAEAFRGSDDSTDGD